MTEENDNVVVPQIDEIQVYLNNAGGVTIEQQSYYGEDNRIYIPRDYVEKVAERMIEIKKSSWG